jgi:hypothetical protein
VCTFLFTLRAKSKCCADGMQDYLKSIGRNCDGHQSI